MGQGAELSAACTCGLHNDRETACTCDGRYASAAQDRAWGRDDWSEATVEEMRTRLDEIGPPWGNPKIPKALAESFWIAYEALERLETT